jgi:uncharacterized membrane protein YqjE
VRPVVAKNESRPDAAQAHGLLHSLRKLAVTAAGILQTRLELLATEIEEERLRILQLLLWGCTALIFLSLGLLLLTFAVVTAFWDTHRILVSVAIGVLYLAIGAGLGVVAYRRSQRSKMLAASLVELAKDRRSLGS